MFALLIRADALLFEMSLEARVGRTEAEKATKAVEYFIVNSDREAD